MTEKKRQHRWTKARMRPYLEAIRNGESGEGILAAGDAPIVRTALHAALTSYAVGNIESIRLRFLRGESVDDILDSSELPEVAEKRVFPAQTVSNKHVVAIVNQLGWMQHALQTIQENQRRIAERLGTSYYDPPLPAGLMISEEDMVSKETPEA